MAAVTQGGCDGAASMGQQGASQQDHQFPPRRSRKQWPKGGQNLYNGIGKGHMLSPWQDRCLITLYLTPEVALCPMLSPNCTKSREEEQQIVSLEAKGYIRMREKSEQLVASLTLLITALENTING
jgi:hypothetical protein